MGVTTAPRISRSLSLSLDPNSSQDFLSGNHTTDVLGFPPPPRVSALFIHRSGLRQEIIQGDDERVKERDRECRKRRRPDLPLRVLLQDLRPTPPRRRG